MPSRIYLITHADGCWLKAELPVDEAQALAQAKWNYGDDIASCVPVPADDAAARAHAAQSAPLGEKQEVGAMRRVTQLACADIYYGTPACFMFTPKAPAYWVWDCERGEHGEQHGDYDAGWDRSYTTLEGAIERCAALERLYGSL